MTIDGGAWDCDRTGGYSQWRGSLDTELMVTAQYFADVNGFAEGRGCVGQRVGTNLTLVELVAEAGITIEPPRTGNPDNRLFFTNAVLCMKEGGYAAAVPVGCYKRCGHRFLRPTVELVAPRVAVTLGTGATSSLGLVVRVGQGRLVALLTLHADLAGGQRILRPRRPLRQFTRPPQAQPIAVLPIGLGPWTSRLRGRRRPFPPGGTAVMPARSASRPRCYRGPPAIA
ncbi:MAG: uracil-DNA glycosylase family protein [Phycisphaeraceae bacterium]